MELKELKKQKWNINRDCTIVYNDSAHIIYEEQEAIFNIDKYENTIFFCCSYSKYITKLSKSELVTINRVLVSNSNTNKNSILEIQGTLEISALTIRKKHTGLSEEQKKINVERLGRFGGKK